MNSIEIINLNKKYLKSFVLENINLTIDGSSIFGLLGPNGAGKTTLIRLLTQITKPDSGKILFYGKEITKIDIKRIGYLPEERGLYKKMKVGEQAIYLAILKGLSFKQAEIQLKEWFERLEIVDWWDKNVEELSKGMQQKVQFITSVIHKPDLLILDEPFSGLDPINYQILSREIKRINQEGATVILSTHNMDTVENLCDDIAFINNGEIVLTGAVEDIKQTYKTSTYEICFGGDLFSFRTLLQDMIEIIQVEQYNELYRLIFKIKNDIQVENILRKLLSIIKFVSFKEVLPSIEDIFVNLISTNKIDSHE